MSISNGRDAPLPRRSLALPVRLYIRREGRKISRAVFSPGLPYLAGVLFEDAPPAVFDLCKAEAPEAVVEANHRQAVRLPAFLDGDCLLKLSCPVAATDITFRPRADGECSEVAVALGSEQDVVFRIDIFRGKKLTPVPAENVSAVAYSADGSLIAVGSTTGIVAVYNIVQDEPEILGCEVNVGAPVVSLCFEKGNQRLRIATDLNAFGRLDLYGFDSGHWERDAFYIDDRPEVVALNLHQMACSPETGLLAFGGSGPEIWVFNPEYGQGTVLTAREQQSIRQLQFVDARDEILILGDCGIEVISYERDCFELPQVPRLSQALSPPDDNQPIVGFWQYDDAICAALADPDF